MTVMFRRPGLVGFNFTIGMDEFKYQ